MMDPIDTRIVALLQENGRISNADVARKLAMAPSGVLQRIRRLEERGVIRGYGAEVDPVAVGSGMLAFVFLRTTEPLGDAVIARTLAGWPEVLEVHDIAGEDCYLVKLRVAGPDALHELLRGRIAQLELVSSTSTVIVLKTFKESSRVPIAVDADAD